MNTAPTLVADIGGTNARFALAEQNSPWFSNAQTLQCNDHASIIDAIDTYLKSKGINSLGGISFAVAGQIIDGAMSFVNNDWSISSEELALRYDTPSVRLMNDFEAIAHSLAELGEADLLSIGGPMPSSPSTELTLGVIGPGSGLGVAGIKYTAGNTYPMATEAGHAGFAPVNNLQVKILQYLQGKFHRVSNERLLSGPGLVNIHEALCAINGLQNPAITPADIAVAAREKSDELCVQTMQLFFEVLGQAAGDVALSLGAFDGVFIGGGIAHRYPNQLVNSRFRHGFENKGRYQEMMQSVPSKLITHTNPGLVGASIWAAKNFA